MTNPSTPSMKLRTSPLRIKIAWVRGAYLNNFEGQNYKINKLTNCELRITGFGSLHSIHSQLPFPVIRLSSLSDYNPIGRLGRAIANRTLGDIQNLFGLEKYASQFDIFHTADPHYYYSYQLARLRAANKIKHLLVTSWETIPFNNETVEVKKRNKYFVLKNADHFLCYTERAKECLILEGVSVNKISVIRLGVELHKFKSQITNHNSISNNKSQIIILFVGRLVEEKGVMDVYEAFCKVKSQIPPLRQGFEGQANVKLQIIGEGPLKQILLKKIKQDHLGDCVSIETRTYDDMPSVYRSADIVLLPSKKSSTWEEQYGMVFVEAMAAGKPIISYDTGAIAEILNTPGVIKKEGDVDGLAGAVFKLVNDKNERLKLGTMGRERATRVFDARKVALEIKELYLDIIKGAK